MYSCKFVIISGCKRVPPFHLNKLKSSSPRDAFCQIWLANWPNGIIEESFSNFCFFIIISPWKRVGPFIWKKFTQGCFVICMLEICRLVLERKIFKFVNVFLLFLLFRNYLPFILINLNPLHLRLVCAKFGWKLVQLFWRRRWKCEKLTTTTKTTDELWSEKLTCAFCSGELKNSWPILYSKIVEKNEKLTGF